MSEFKLNEWIPVLPVRNEALPGHSGLRILFIYSETLPEPHLARSLRF